MAGHGAVEIDERFFDRMEELNSKFAEFLSSGLVITDRLHGMIFAAITGTPCIALDNKSPAPLYEKHNL